MLTLQASLPLAVVARAGRRPKRSAGSLVRPVARLMAITGLSALAAGILGWMLARHGEVLLVGDLAQQVPADKHVAFLAELWAHSASYLVGSIGGIVLLVLVWRSRGGSTASRIPGSFSVDNLEAR